MPAASRKAKTESTRNVEVQIRALNDSINYWRGLYEKAVQTSDYRAAKLVQAERDLQRVALAYETVRSTVHLTSVQLNLEGINPAITSAITSIVKTDQTNQTNQELE